ncbi:MAG: Rho termination factor [Alphaproteobacteria bacterium]|nr:Rho termination factor [Alphaproteobacteria bacterium]
MAKKHGPSIKKSDTYEALRDQGASKEKAARIANAQADADRNPSKKGGESSAYGQWTKKELYDRAAEREIDGRSSMNKDELIQVLRDH